MTKTNYKTDYSKKFLDPKWQKFRLSVLQRDKFRCVRCDDDKSTLHAHHTYYEEFGTDPWDYEEDTVITLCERCHEDEHANQKRANKELMNCIDATGISWADKAALSVFFSMLNKKLPVDFWSVFMMMGTDKLFYEKAKELYYDETCEIPDILRGLRDDAIERILDNE